jgi:hypothetical protein
MAWLIGSEPSWWQHYFTLPAHCTVTHIRFRNTMSNRLDRYLFYDVPHTVNLQRRTEQSTDSKINDAIHRMQSGLTDSYDSISILSLIWKNDNTGAGKDSELFIKTMSKLRTRNLQLVTHQRSLADNQSIKKLKNKVLKKAALHSSKRKLFILHYAGHAIAGNTPDILMITPKHGHPGINMSHVEERLKVYCSESAGLDILLVLDCCYASRDIARRLGDDSEDSEVSLTKGARMELVVATAPEGTTNSRAPGRMTFTQHWCATFTKLLDIGKPFTCDDILQRLIRDSKPLEQFPSVFILHKGWDLPITFCGPLIATGTTPGTVVMSFHVEEGQGPNSLANLIDYINGAPSPSTVLAVLPESSTFFLLRVPMPLQEELNDSYNLCPCLCFLAILTSKKFVLLSPSFRVHYGDSPLILSTQVSYFLYILRALFYIFRLFENYQWSKPYYRRNPHYQCVVL